MSPAAWARRTLLLTAGRRSAQDPANGILYRSYSAAGEIVAGGRKKRWSGRRVVAIAAISLAGGMALSGINDLAIFHGCTRKAIETATENRDVVETIGVPILRGPWYDASVVLGHRRRSVSCTFPVTGPQGSGLFQIEAVRSGDDGMLAFLRHHDWEICAMDAHLEVASDDDKLKKVTINLVSGSDQSSGGECKAES
uniref:Uncharacterized protein n=1 Tax=Avena sativa TaxID=4498 RepID=A0ACD5VZN4_AVESA